MPLCVHIWIKNRLTGFLITFINLGKIPKNKLQSTNMSIKTTETVRATIQNEMSIPKIENAPIMSIDDLKISLSKDRIVILYSIVDDFLVVFTLFIEIYAKTTPF
jgi:hypothetical protein